MARRSTNTSSPPTRTNSPTSTRAISEMGGMVEQAITEAATALLKLDHEQAQDVRARTTSRSTR